MATLIPGILLKLLQSITSTTEITGNHRRPLFQVIGIVPALSTSDFLSPNHGYYVQLSDSRNSTYVSLSDRDTILIRYNHLQVGQFVHLDRLIFDSPPFPTPLNLSPIAGRHKFIGSPKTLIIHSNNGAFAIQPISESDPSVNSFAAYLSRMGKMVIESKENFNVNGSDKAGSKRFSSKKRSVTPSGKKQVLVERDPSPAGNSIKRLHSPATSKCVVPSLEAVKEENWRTLRKPAIIVPSRYHHPSPTLGTRQASTTVARRMSLSPGRMLSGGFMVSQALDSSRKKKMDNLVAGISKVS